MMNTKKRSPLDMLAVLLATAAIALVSANVLAGCAGWGQETCAAIDLAHSACPLVVKYVSEDGQQHTMAISHEDAKQLGAQKMAGSRDGGADAK
jgi:hypothetical protein